MSSSAHVTFDLSTGHLGDALMALPAMRAGDSVIARRAHRVPGAPVSWLDAGSADVRLRTRDHGHATDAWLRATGRAATRHQLLSEVPKTLTVIAPAVAAPAKQWGGWQALMRALPHAVVVMSSLSRAAWMRVLNRAHTVICPDTGTAHMADALGCPRVIALHGVPENWPRCAPYWNRAHCIARPSMAQIALGDVLEAVRA